MEAGKAVFLETSSGGLGKCELRCNGEMIGEKIMETKTENPVKLSLFFWTVSESTASSSSSLLPSRRFLLATRTHTVPPKIPPALVADGLCSRYPDGRCLRWLPHASMVYGRRIRSRRPPLPISDLIVIASATLSILTLTDSSTRFTRMTSGVRSACGCRSGSRM